MGKRLDHAPGYDTLSPDERRIAHENGGEVSCAAENDEGYLCTRQDGHDGRHTAFGGRFLGAWGERAGAPR